MMLGRAADRYQNSAGNYKFHQNFSTAIPLVHELNSFLTNRTKDIIS